ncbi:MAG: Hsp20/alpha crystallin family protein [Desulfuromonadales bacterium]|nr:Hsp20/alpha crystallin family protein [Desulfuromonadales bacterium]MBN2645025.1 Hsp20/alpha crystallin family protein [Desulfuromonadaceae bacterium]
MTAHEISKQQETVPANREEIRSPGRVLVPAVDIFESIESLTLTADMPGVEKSGLEISLEKGILTIKGTVESVGRGRPILQEFSAANYYRQFKIPDLLDGDKSFAELRNGVLTLIIPKSEAAKPKRIEIRS